MKEKKSTKKGQAMTAPVDPERSKVERAHRIHSTYMEVLIRIPFEPLNVSVYMIAKDIFKDRRKHHIIRYAIEKLVKEGYGIREYSDNKGNEFVYIEDGKTIDRSQAWATANAYDKAIYSQHHIPTPKNIMPTKTKNSNGIRSWPGFFKITHAKMTTISRKSSATGVSGYTDESKRKRNETVRRKKGVAGGNAV